jgi:hypothetical protein
LTIGFAPDKLPDGVYSLRILETATDLAGQPLDGNGDGIGGDAYEIVGDVQNRFYKLTADFNGDSGVTIFDFTTFAYWFGHSVVPQGAAPQYPDLNGDEGITIFDFGTFAANFGQVIRFAPMLLPPSVNGSPESQYRISRQLPNASTDVTRTTANAVELPVAHDAALLEVLAEWAQQRSTDERSFALEFVRSASDPDAR